MMTEQIVKSVDFTKAQKSRYLKNKTIFFLQIKKVRGLVAEVTFNICVIR